MRFWLVFYLQLFSLSVFAQKISRHSSLISKPVIDTSSFAKWAAAVRGDISKDGNYVCFTIASESIGYQGTDTLVLKSLRGSWEEKITRGTNAAFLSNSESIIFTKGSDSICLLELGSDRCEWITGIGQYQLWGSGRLQNLIYSKKNKKGELIVRNLQSNQEKVFSGVVDFHPYTDSKTIFLKQEKEGGGQWTQSLTSLNIGSLEVVPIWSTTDSGVEIKLDNIAFDTIRGQVAFQVSKGDNNAIWHCRLGSGTVTKLIDNYSSELSGLKIGDLANPGFNIDGTKVFFSLILHEKADSLPAKQYAIVDIWNYRDEALQSQQLYQLENGNGHADKQYLAVISLADHRVVRIGFDHARTTLFKGERNDYAFVEHWGKFAPESTDSLLSIGTGQKLVIGLYDPDISFAGRYLFGYNKAGQFCYTYNLETGKLSNISLNFPKICRLEQENKAGRWNIGLSVVGWMAKDTAILMQDRYDLWKVDPEGKRPAVNVTGFYGRRHHIIFRLIPGSGRNRAVDGNSTYILSAFDEITKESGFFSLCMGKKGTLRPLSMGLYCYNVHYGADFKWLQLGASPTYLVQIESASVSPNYYKTVDFVHFEPISAVNPEAAFNWLISKVIHWMGPDKVQLNGVLYLPEDFDSSKRYPVIINYYETVSNTANEYIRPATTGDNIDIPWFVSRGYILFRPDIKYTIGHPGQSALNAVVSGTKYIMQYKWVNRKRIGLQGHSWGGYETNYIVTHSHLYAAALSASGPSDFVSGYGSLFRTGASEQYMYEVDQCRMGCTPWQRPDLYVENSPIFFVDRVTTPLLMMNNKEDAVVLFNQGVELFTALQRAHKKAWMLQYDGEPHSLHQKKNQIDYTIRMTQFFDHYLKGYPAPKWMNVGIPAYLKGRDSGLEMESELQRQ